jgi:raffinose synthase
MLSFYAGASDFTRRLVSPKANAKFSSVDAGPEDEGGGRGEDLAAVVRHVKDRCALPGWWWWWGAGVAGGAGRGGWGCW